MKPKTLFDKIWDDHVVRSIDEGPDVLYIDRHYIHEVTSPQAFNGLRKEEYLYYARKGPLRQPTIIYLPKTSTCRSGMHYQGTR